VTSAARQAESDARAFQNSEPLQGKVLHRFSIDVEAETGFLRCTNEAFMIHDRKVRTQHSDAQQILRHHTSPSPVIVARNHFCRSMTGSQPAATTPG
jgi:hypothetical protein